MTWDQRKLDRLERHPLWIWFVQKPFMAFLDAIDKIMDGKVTDQVAVADLNRIRGGVS